MYRAKAGSDKRFQFARRRGNENTAVERWRLGLLQFSIWAARMRNEEAFTLRKAPPSQGAVFFFKKKSNVRIKKSSGKKCAFENVIYFFAHFNKRKSPPPKVLPNSYSFTFRFDCSHLFRFPFHLAFIFLSVVQNGQRGKFLE